MLPCAASPQPVNNLAILLSSLGHYEEAQQLFHRAVDVQERILGPEHPNTCNSVCNLASLLHALGRHDEAARYYRRDLEASEKLLGPDHPDTLTSGTTQLFMHATHLVCILPALKPAVSGVGVIVWRL